MVQSTEVRERDDLAYLRRLDLTWFGTIILQRLMRSRSVVARKVLTKYSPKVGLIQNDDMIETVPPDGPDQAFTIRILPGRLWRRDHFLDIHRRHSANEFRAESPVSITQQISRSTILRKRLDNLRCAGRTSAAGPGWP